MTPRDVLLTAIGVLTYAVWGATAYFVDRSLLGAFVTFTISVVNGVIWLVLRDMQPPKNANGDVAP
jgi:hypothetical protein